MAGQLPIATFLGTLISLLCMAGCGNQTSAVTGKISYRGRPVVVGSVVLVNEETQAFTQEPIQPDGTYTAQVPPGVYKIAVHSPDPGKRPELRRPVPDDLKKKPKDTIAPPRPPDAKWFAIPERYSDWRQSDLSVAVSQPGTTFDINLGD